VSVRGLCSILVGLALLSLTSGAEAASARAYAWKSERRGSTEVHFFNRADLSRSIAKYSGVTTANADGVHRHGQFARLRIGPKDITKRARIRPGDDIRSLKAGDELVYFAINHATGHAGMGSVVVPDVRTGFAIGGAFTPDAGPGTDAGTEDLGEVAYNGIPEIIANIKLFPPEVEIEVERQLKPVGVAALPDLSFIRESGAASSTDTYLRVGTRWRVRLRPAAEDDIVDGALRVDAGPGAPTALTDGGVLDTIHDAGTGIAAKVDRGVKGAPLERLCAELDDNATARERIDCLNDEYTLTDVPTGIPPLAARFVGLGDSSNDLLYHIAGGANDQQLVMGRQVTSADGVESKLPLLDGLYALHVVGRPLGLADTDGDGALSPEELNIGTPDIQLQGAAIQQAAPDFRDGDGQTRGLPAKAIAIKAVYTARLASGDGTTTRKVPSFDRTMEHRFRVVSIAGETQVRNGDTTETIAHSDTESQLEEGIDSVSLLLELLDTGGEEADENNRDLSRPGDYAVRLGSDDAGIACSVTTTQQATDRQAITGTCDGASLDEVISATDIVYLELFLSGNSDNVLFRHNLYGTKLRRDLAVAGSDFTAEKSSEDVNGASFALAQAARSSTPQLNQALFFIDPTRLTEGIVRLCLDENCTQPNTRLKELNITGYSQASGFSISARPVDGEVNEPVSPLAFVEGDGPQWFEMMLPAEMSKMPGAPHEGKRFWVQYEPSRAQRVSDPNLLKKSSLQFRVGEGRFDTRSAAPAGQQVEAGIVLADGRLVRGYEDFTLPDLGVSRTFARAYDNGNNKPSPLGTGWSHSFEGSVFESYPGRYQVELFGQGYDFPSCTVERNAQHGVIAVTNCTTDKAHSGSLTVSVAPHPTDPSRYASWSATFNDGAGTTYSFAREAKSADRLGRRRLMLTGINDGIDAHPLELHYDGVAPFGGDDHVDRVTRAGSWDLAFTYVAIPPDIDTWRLPIPIAAERLRGNLPRLTKVEAKLSGSPVVVVEFDHDYDDATVCGAAPASRPPVRYGRLLSVCRQTRANNDDGSIGGLARDELWTYGYAAVPSTIESAFERFAAGNELSSEKLELPQSPSPVVQQAGFDRTAPAHAYPHRRSRLFEAVTRTNLPGRSVVVEYARSATERPVTTEDGTESVTQLNRYGNTTKHVDASGTTSLKWLSNDETGCVVPDETTAPGSEKTAHRYSASCLANEHEVMSLPSGFAGSKGHGIGTKITVLSRDPTTNEPTQVRHATGSDNHTINSTVSSTGVAMSSVLEGAPSNNESVALDSLMRVSGGSSPDGSFLVTSYDEAGFGQPTAIQRTCSACGTPQSAQSEKTRTTTMAYDSLGRVRRVSVAETDSTTVMKFDALGRIVREVTEGEGGSGENVETWTTTYSLNAANGQVTVVRSLQGTSVTSTTTFDALGRLTSVRDGAGRENVTEYDGNSARPTRVYRNADGVQLTLIEYEYNNAKTDVRLVKEHDLLGNVSTTTFDELGRPIEVSAAGEVDKVEYDHLGRVNAIKRNCSGATCLHNLEVEWSANHTVQTTKSVPATGGFFERRTLDASLRDRTLELGHSATSIGLTEEVAYDIDGRVLESTTVVKNRTSELEHFEARTYGDIAGARFVVAGIATERDGSVPTGTATYTLNKRGRLSTVERSGDLFPGSPGTDHYYIEDAQRYVTGLEEVSTSPAGTVGMQERFDGFGRTTRTARLDATFAETPIATMTYTGVGGRIDVKEVVHPPTSETANDGITCDIIEVRDARGRAVFEQRPANCELGGDANAGVRINSLWDGDDRLQSVESNFSGTERGRFTWDRDDAGRVIVERYIDGIAGRPDFWRQTTWTNGQQASVQDLLADAPFSTNLYDGRGLLISIDQAGGETRTIRDAASTVLRVEHPAGFTVATNVYPADGKVLSETLPNGDMVVFGYRESLLVQQRQRSALLPEAGYLVQEPGFCVDGEVAAASIPDLAEKLWDLIADGQYFTRYRLAVEYFGNDPTTWPCEVRVVTLPSIGRNAESAFTSDYLAAVGHDVGVVWGAAVDDTGISAIWDAKLIGGLARGGLTLAAHGGRSALSSAGQLSSAVGSRMVPGGRARGFALVPGLGGGGGSGGGIALGYNTVYELNGVRSATPALSNFPGAKSSARKAVRVIDDSLTSFAGRVGAEHYHQFKVGTPGNSVLEIVENAASRAGRIHFNLDGFTRRSLSATAQRIGGGRGFVTERELELVLRKFKGKTTFYRAGRVVENPASFFGKYWGGF